MTRHPLAIAALISLSSCGPLGSPFDLTEAGADYDSPDSVFLYALNAYAETDTITVKGPGGRIANNLGYYERSSRDGTCPIDDACVPTSVRRSKGTVFKVKAGGRTVELDLTEELNAFYPHETGTVIIRSGGAEGIDATVVRHTQSISSQCELGVVNALSGGPVDSDAGYRFAMEWKMESDEAGYRDESGEALLTACGALPTEVGEHDAIARQSLRDSIGDNPWFVGIECELGWCPAWSSPAADGRAVIDDSGGVEVHPTTDEYFACLQDAVTLKTPGACPADLSWADVELDQQKVAECARPRRMQARLTKPGQTTVWGQETDCDTEFRLRTPGRDLLFGPDDAGFDGKHQDGELLTSRILVNQGDRHYWVVMGRPVNPDVWQWASADTFVDLAAFPIDR